MFAEDVTSLFDCVFWFGDLNSRMQKDRDQLELMLGTRQQDTTRRPINYDDIVQHDELTRVLYEGSINALALQCQSVYYCFDLWLTRFRSVSITWPE